MACILHGAFRESREELCASRVTGEYVPVTHFPRTRNKNKYCKAVGFSMTP